MTTLTADEQRVVLQVASDLYELARPKRGDTDGTFVSVRRQYLTALAAQLAAIGKREH